tara:strand:+ start:9857 stop:10528 length:672 start_codon:yes stop_codon:yes gene_type:complete
MPTRECNHLDEKTGHKCRKSFKVPSNNYRKYRCAEHEHHQSNRGNLRAAGANLNKQKRDLREFVQGFKDDTLPAIQVKLLEGIHEREELSKRLDAIKIPSKEEWQGSLAPTSLEDIIRNSPELTLDISAYKLQINEFYEEMSKIHNAYIKRTKTAHSDSLSDFRALKKEIENEMHGKLDSFSLEAEITTRFANQINTINNRNVSYEKRIAALEKKLNGRWPSN